MDMRQRLEGAVAEADLQFGSAAAKAQVGVLEAPAPVVVAKAIDALEIGAIEGGNGAEETLIVLLQHQPMPDEPSGALDVRIVRPYGQVVDVVEAKVVRSFPGDQETGVFQSSPVERFAVQLFDNMNRVAQVAIELVAPEIGLHMRQKLREMLWPIAVRHDDGKGLRVRITTDRPIF